jgi:hypothetical protein
MATIPRPKTKAAERVKSDRMAKNLSGDPWSRIGNLEQING